MLPSRLIDLQHRAVNKGYSLNDLKRLAGRGQKLETIEGTHIALSPKELSELLKLADFKVYVHKRLDDMGIPESNPGSEHDKAGCRIGGRLDLVEESLHRLAGLDN